MKIENNLEIGKMKIGNSHPPFIIAEMSGNHNQSIERAIDIISAAAEAGAHAVKLQTYTADTITVKGAYTISDKNSLWYGRELYDLYSEAYTPWEWHKELFEHAKKKDLLIFSSPFDESSVDFLESLDIPVYKIASFENTHHPLLKKVARTGKPVIMSTGVASINDILESVQVLKENGCKELVLLKCTSTYPASPADTNLHTIPILQEIFPDCVIGLSDHTRGIGTSVAAVALGARVIEKHFTLNRDDGGVDSDFSLEPSELKSLVEECERAFMALGSVQLNIQDSEKSNMTFKRSIYIVEDIKAGETFTPGNIRVIRPGYGLAPKYYDHILGRKAERDFKKGTPLTRDAIII